MFWKINFTIDTGYEWLNRVCIIIAEDAKEAEDKFNKWISPKLHGEYFVERSQTKIEPIILSEDNSGILYQNCFIDNN